MLFSCSLNKNIDNTEWSYVFSLKYQMDLLYVFWDCCDMRVETIRKCDECIPF